MEDQKAILLISSANDLGDKLVAELEKAGFSPRLVASLNEARDYLSQCGLPSVLIVDLEGLGEQGILFCEDLNYCAGLPIIVLGSRDAKESAVTALPWADDYVRRPDIGGAELVSRVQNLLKRVNSLSYVGGPNLQVTDKVTVNLVDRKLEAQGKTSSMTPIEVALLHVLLVHRGKFVANDTLMDRVWRSGEGNTNALRVHMHRLRRKLGDSIHEPEFLRTIRGYGYMLV